MQLISEDKQRQEKEKKAKARLKAKEKARSEKEKERADKEARERQSREAEAEARRKAEIEAEEARKRRAEELEAIRKAEEEVMERRRKELLADEDSHWRHRARQEEMLAAQAELEQEMLRQAVEEAEEKERTAATATATVIATATSNIDEGFTVAGSKKATSRKGPARDQKDQRSGRDSARDSRDNSNEIKEIPKLGKGSQKDLLSRATSAAGNNKNNNNNSNGSGNGSLSARDRPRSQAQGKPQQQQKRLGTADGARDSTIGVAVNSSSSEIATVLPNGAAWGPPLAPTSPENIETAAPVSSQSTTTTAAPTAAAAAAAAVPAEPREQSEVTSQETTNGSQEVASQTQTQPPRPSPPQQQPQQQVATVPAVVPLPMLPQPPQTVAGVPARVVQPPVVQGGTTGHIPLPMQPPPGGMMPMPHGIVPQGIVPMPMPPHGIVPIPPGAVPMSMPRGMPPGHAPAGPSMHSRNGSSMSVGEMDTGNSPAPHVGPILPTGAQGIPGHLQPQSHGVGVVPGMVAGHPPPHFVPSVAGGSPQPPQAVYGGVPPPPPPPGGHGPPQGMRPPMPMFFHHGAPMVDGNGRLLRHPPPPPSFVLPNGLVPPPHGLPPGMHLPMGPVTMGQPLPAGGRFPPTRQAPSPGAARQLRVTAQVFVPSGQLQRAASAGGAAAAAAAPSQEQQRPDSAKMDTSASSESGGPSTTTTTATSAAANIPDVKAGEGQLQRKLPSSPRGILEPAENSSHGGAQVSSDEIESPSGMSKAESTEAEPTGAEVQERSAGGPSAATGAASVNHIPVSSGSSDGLKYAQATTTTAATVPNGQTVPPKQQLGLKPNVLVVPAITPPQYRHQQQQLQLQQRGGNGNGPPLPSPRVPSRGGGWVPQPQNTNGPGPGPGPAAFEQSQQEIMLTMVSNRQGTHNTAGVAAVGVVGPAQQQKQQGKPGLTPRQHQLTPRMPSPPLDVSKLRSIRGLSNSPGVYNCFLNAIVQSLWHLPAFRRALLAVTPADLQRHAANGNANARVLISLRAIFEELSALPGAVSNATIPAAVGDEAQGPLKPVNPQKLREALGGSRFEHGDMHDAAEVLGELFDRLHAAEVGPGGNDPTLPRRLRIDAPSPAATTVVIGGRAAPPPPPPRPPPPPPPAPATPAAAGLGSGSSPSAAPSVASSVWGNAAALKKVKRAPAAAPRKDMSMVQKIFGMEVQTTLSSDSKPRQEFYGRKIKKPYYIS